MTWNAGEDVNHLIEFMLDGEYIEPTSATVTIRDNLGHPLPGLIDVPLTLSGTSVLYTIPAPHNTIDPSRDFELRFVSVQFEWEGKIFRTTEQYRLTPFTPLTVTCGDVRRLLGLDQSEVPDGDVKIWEAYFQLRNTYGERIENALTSGDIKTVAVNQAIAAKAALELVTGLEFRAAIKLQAENSALGRMATFDVNKIRVHLGQKMTQALDTVLDITTGGSPILILGNPTDAITGE